MSEVIIPKMKPNKYIHKKTRELIAEAMLDDARAGWYETAQNPRKPDAVILVEVLEQTAKIARMVTERNNKENITVQVADLAAITVAWLQGNTYQEHVKPWS